MDNEKYIECGKIVNTHGLDGGMKVESWCDSPEVLSDLDSIFILDGERFIEKKIIRSAIQKRNVLLWLEGISDANTVDKYKNRVIYTLRDVFELDENTYFIADMIGLQVIDNDSSKVYGKIINIFNAGASDVYVVKTEDGEKMFPAVREFVKKVDLKSGVFITPIEGMFD